MPEPLPRWLIVDRDGVLNADRPDYVLTPDQFQPLPGAFEALARFTRAGVRLAVATNQSAIGRGWLSVAGLAAIHARLLHAADRAGARIEAIAWCPHAPGAGCACRKPAPGLLLTLARCLRFDPRDALFAGDRARDLDAACAAGLRGIALGPALTGADAPHFADLPALATHYLGPDA